MWHWMMKEAAGFANPPTGWGTHLRLRWAVVMREDSAWMAFDDEDE